MRVFDTADTRNEFRCRATAVVIDVAIAVVAAWVIRAAAEHIAKEDVPQASGAKHSLEAVARVLGSVARVGD
jgi:hypothetical protein